MIKDYKDCGESDYQKGMVAVTTSFNAGFEHFRTKFSLKTVISYDDNSIREWRILMTEDSYWLFRVDAA